MSQNNILLTGGSGYLGGDLLARWKGADLPKHGTLFVLVRSPKQAEVAKKHGATPLELDLTDGAAVEQALTEHSISIVLFLVANYVDSVKETNLIKALAKVKAATGKEVHFINTTGAKGFSVSFGGPSFDRNPLPDNASDLYNLVEKATTGDAPLAMLSHRNLDVIRLGEEHAVKTYIFAPCIAYGRGLSEGNPVSKQTTAIVLAAKAAGQVFSVDDGKPTWPVCHVEDNTALYVAILRAILNGDKPPSGRNGFYLAASGSVAWLDLYKSVATAMHEKGIIKTAEVVKASQGDVERMAGGLEPSYGTPWVQMGGLCTFEARQGATIGWKPKYSAQHAIEAMHDEVDLVLGHHQS